MAQPTAYNRNEDFTQRPGDETNHPALNSEFDAAAQSINQIRANLALLQADSGGLKPGIVGPDQLSQAARYSLIPDVAQATADAQSAAASAVSAATAANSANAAAQAAKSGAETAASAAALNAQAALAAAQSLNAENLLQKSQNLNDLPDKAAARSALGLGNVNNTSDADKPISIAGQNALNSKAGITGSSGSLIIPAGPTANRDPSPQPGYKRWNTELGVEEIYNGTIWVCCPQMKLSADGLSATLQVGGTDKVTIGPNGIEAGSLAPQSVTAGSYAPQSITPNDLSQKLTLGASVASTSGTAIDFTGIPSWVKRITVMLNGVSTSGTATLMIQVGSSSGFETTGYVGVCGTQTYSNGFLVNTTTTAADLMWGQATIIKTGSNPTQVQVTGILANSNAAYTRTFCGAVTPANTLDRIRITTATGTDTFDAGSINLIYE